VYLSTGFTYTGEIQIYDEISEQVMYIEAHPILLDMKSMFRDRIKYKNI